MREREDAGRVAIGEPEPHRVVPDLLDLEQIEIDVGRRCGPPDRALMPLAVRARTEPAQQRVPVREGSIVAPADGELLRAARRAQLDGVETRLVAHRDLAP